MKQHALMLWVALALLAAATAYFAIQSVDARNHQNDALHTIICSIVQYSQRSHHISLEKKHQTVEFWARELKDAHLNPCP